MPNVDRAVKAVGQRHESFRTAFFEDSKNNNVPTQGVFASSLLRLEEKAISNEQDASKEIDAMLKHSFDIENGETIRIMLLSVKPDLHYIIFSVHHIVMDGFSFSTLLADLNKLYQAQSIPKPPYQYTEFATKQRRDVEAGLMSKEIEVWRKKFPDFPDPVPLFPMAKVQSRHTMKEYAFQETSMTIGKATMAKIRECSKHRTTPFHFFLAALNAFLYRLLDVDDLCIGVADANRLDSKTIDTIGFLLNLLPVRFKSSNHRTFSEDIVQARDKSNAALANSRLPFDVLLEELAISRSSTHSPLFQVFLDYRRLQVKTPPMLECQVESEMQMGRTGYDLVADIVEIQGEDVSVAFRTQDYLYSRSSTEMLLKSYIRLIESLAADFGRNTSEVFLFDDGELKATIEKGRG